MTNEQLEWGPDEGEMTHDEAVAFAAAKGDGWRLPTVPELTAQFDYGAGKPRDPSWRRDYYWSSSVCSGNTPLAWGVYFSYGYTHPSGVSSPGRVRCVRSVGGGEL